MSVRVEKLSGRAFLAFSDMASLLTSELSSRFNYGSISSAATIAGEAFRSDLAKWYGELLFCPDWSRDENPYWARTCLLEPLLIHFESIGEAASALKEIQRNWAPYQFQLFRRASLIQEKLPHINLKDRPFIFDIPSSPMGLYTLLDEHTMLASAVTSSALPAGKITFIEDHENPPSRAYLKVQEGLTMARHFFGMNLPSEGSACFEAGACPGGWTWVLRKLGAEVFAVDRAPLADSLMNDSHVHFLAHDAFTLKPEEICREMGVEKLDWVFSDVICYPERLFEWVNLWLSSGRTKNMLCTIKMQGAVDWDLVSRFAAIPKSRVVHLNYNKHELTFIHAE